MALCRIFNYVTIETECGISQRHVAEGFLLQEIQLLNVRCTMHMYQFGGGATESGAAVSKKYTLTKRVTNHLIVCISGGGPSEIQRKDNINNQFMDLQNQPRV